MLVCRWTTSRRDSCSHGSGRGGSCVLAKWQFESKDESKDTNPAGGCSVSVRGPRQRAHSTLDVDIRDPDDSDAVTRGLWYVMELSDYSFKI